MFSLPQFPPRLTLELTNACNYSCLMCPSRFKPEIAKGFMEPELFRSVVDQAAEHLPVALVPFFRGESLLHPQIVPLLAYAKQRGLGPIQLASNGSLVDDRMARGLLDLGLDFLSFSLDTMRPEEYLELRRGEPLERVVENILHLIELRDQGGYRTEVQVSATRTDLNSQSVDELVAFWRDKADRTRIYYEHSSDGHPGSLDCPEVPKEMERRACQKPFHDMVVYYDGLVALCNHDWFRPEPLGDLREQPVLRVWHGAPYQDLRRQHQEPGRMSDPSCLHCDHWKMYYQDKPFIGQLYTKGGAQ